MNSDGEGKAPSPEKRDISEQQSDDLLSDYQSATDEPSLRMTRSGMKRKQTSLLEGMNDTHWSLRVPDDSDPPLFDFRSIPIRKQFDELNPYLENEKHLKDWEDILLLADSHTKAASQEMMQCGDLLSNLEKKLEEADDSIGKLINFEKENSELIKRTSNELGPATIKIDRLKDYSRQVVQRHKNSLLYYARKFEMKDESDQEVEQPESMDEEETESEESSEEEMDETSYEEETESSDDDMEETSYEEEYIEISDDASTP